MFGWWFVLFPYNGVRRAFIRKFINPKIMSGMRKAGLFPTLRFTPRRRWRRRK
jgi:hypothetical protein